MAIDHMDYNFIIVIFPKKKSKLVCYLNGQKNNGVVTMKKIVISENGKRLVSLTASMEYIGGVRQ